MKIVVGVIALEDVRQRILEGEIGYGLYDALPALLDFNETETFQCFQCLPQRRSAYTQFLSDFPFGRKGIARFELTVI